MDAQPQAMPGYAAAAGQPQAMPGQPMPNVSGQPVVG